MIYRKSFGKRLTFVYLSAFIAVFSVTGIYINHSLHHLSLERLRGFMATECELLANILTPELVSLKDRPYIHQLVHQLSRQAKASITVIDPDGLVLGDSNASWEKLLTMDDHSERAEVRHAVLEGLGSSIRYSKTEKIDMLYLAYRLGSREKPAGFIRLAMPLISVRETLALVRHPIVAGILIGIVCVLSLGFLLGRHVSGRIRILTEAAERFSSGRFDQKVYMTGQDELNQFADTMNSMASALRKRIEEIESEKTKVS
ncbi:MAG: HAMP domain-containing protein, partial [Candidatus Omnitrophica bacterium]|nr:HAMP domain-containing protein [Candidatus Omnitrophota bacterium]